MPWYDILNQYKYTSYMIHEKEYALETENLQKSQGAEGASATQEKTPETPETPETPDNRPVAIRVKNLYKIYRVGETKVRALNGVDFELYKGEFVAIVGTSGSGKSTLLNMLAGLEKPTKGEIEIGKVHIEKLTERQLVTFRREKVGFIFQAYNLLNTMNAVENVALPLAFRGISKRERLKRAKRFMKLVGVGDQANHMPNQMSGGQQQRVGIARALVVNPQIIFADEPTGNLDSKTTMEVLRLMQKIVREQNQTLVMVTHDNNLASYADRRIRIVDGKIVGIEVGARPDGELTDRSEACHQEGNQGGEQDAARLPEQSDKEDITVKETRGAQ